MYNKAKCEYHLEEISPFMITHHVVATVLSASGVMNLCAKRVADSNMYMSTEEKRIIRMHF